MKILVLASNARGYRAFFSGIALDLKNQFGHDVIMAMENNFSDFLGEENFFNGETFFAQEYLNQNNIRPSVPDDFPFENLAGTTLVDIDRIEEFRTYDRSTRDMLEKLPRSYLDFFWQLFISEKFEAVVFENVSSTFGHVAYLVAQFLKIPFLGVTASRLPGRSEIYDSLCGPKQDLRAKFVDMEMTELTSNETQYINEYFSNILQVQPDYMKGNELLAESPFWSRYFSVAKVRVAIGILRFLPNHSRTDLTFVQTGSPLRFAHAMVNRAIKRKLKLRMIAKYFDDAPSSRYFLYPVHFHPESATSVLAPDYINEYEVIRRLASLLPSNTLLFVKDHRSAAGFPDLDFYRRVSRVPNVRLIHYNQNTKNLIKGSLAIVTLTSTVGHEAIILGKPVILLGDVYYKFFPGCHLLKRISDFGKVAQEIADRSMKNESFPYSDKISILRYIATYLRFTFPAVISLNGKRPEIGFAIAIDEFLSGKMASD
ncbi:MAG: hypothetical protein EOO45_00105 [Flavobacterium sp.]|nr:MAG: hypothetical protein EOO45_00105 [Flavobacterium sp.]